MAVGPGLGARGSGSEPRTANPESEPPHLRSHASPHFARTLLHTEGTLWVSVETQSMTPLLRPGDQVELQPCSPTTLALGDLIAIDDGEMLLIHRLVSFTPSHLITKGDALPQADRPRSGSSVVGKVTAAKHREKIGRIGGRWASVLLARYSLFLTHLRLPPSGQFWRLTRIPFYLLARCE